MTVQFHPRAQLPALQLLFFLLVCVSYPKWDAQGWMLGRGREDGRS